MEIKFESDKNKGVVWDILMENEKFLTSVKDDFKKTKELFENCIKLVSEESKNETTIGKNKNLIKSINSKLMEKNLFLSKDIKKQKQDEFNKDLKKKEIDFQNSMKKITPENIDFSDKIDEPIVNLNEIMEKKIKERNYEGVKDENLIIVDNSESAELESVEVESVHLENEGLETIENDLKEDSTKKTIVWDETNNDEINIDVFSKLKQTTNSIEELSLNDISRQITSLEKKMKSWFLILNKKIEEIKE
tara:strand:- start:1430 stop:2176 length:747 start_codon:yes stop_codon:yes gene_type:complete